MVSPLSVKPKPRLRCAQVRRKLEPLEKGFWMKALSEIGFPQEAKREKAKLLGVQQAELGSLSLVLRRYELIISVSLSRVHSSTLPSGSVYCRFLSLW